MKVPNAPLLWMVFAFVHASIAEATEPYTSSGIEDLMMQKIQSKPGKKKGSRYFMTLYSYQDQNEDDKVDPKASHTFATYTEVDTNGNQHSTTISWLPAEESERNDLCVFKGKFWFIPGKNECGPTKGQNFSYLKDTLDMAVKDNRKLGMWGPFEVKKELYDLSQKRIQSLNNNELKYVADDRAKRKSGEAVNCLHAVSDLGNTRTEQGGFLKTELGIWGFKGTRHILNHYIKYSDQWLADSIGPEDFREFNNDVSQAKSPKRKVKIIPKINKH